MFELFIDFLGFFGLDGDTVIWGTGAGGYKETNVVWGTAAGRIQ